MSKQLTTEKNTTRKFYIDSAKGKDTNTGSSLESPWQTLNNINEMHLKPGDEVLLHRDSIFNDQYLHIQGSGDESSPIIIRPYGDGDKKPVINANGSGQWYQNYEQALDSGGHSVSNTVSSAILLRDVEYIEIYDLEITNSGPDGVKAYNDIDVMCRTGVAVWAQNSGKLNHIILDGLYVHDIIGNVYEKTLANGGIVFSCGKAQDEEETGIPRFNNIKIQNNIVERANRWGISFGYTAY